jgi:hypothetical protein
MDLPLVAAGGGAGYRGNYLERLEERQYTRGGGRYILMVIWINE